MSTTCLRVRVIRLPPSESHEKTLRYSLMATMGEYLHTLGYKKILLDFPWLQEDKRPPLIEGSIHNYRPHVCAVWPHRRGQAVLLDVIPTLEVLKGEETLRRWELFSSASEVFGHNFQVATFSSLLPEVKLRLLKEKVLAPSGRQHYVWGL